MARIFIDGFESGNLGCWTITAGTPAVVSTSGLDLDGNYCLSMPWQQYCVAYFLPSAISEFYFAIRLRCFQSQLLNVWGVYDTSTLVACLAVNCGTGVFTVRNGNNDILASSVGSLVSLNITFLIESYFKLADSGGRFVIKLNGVIIIDFTGDTKYGSYTTFNVFKMGYTDGSTGSTGQYVDNVILDNADWIGETSIQAIAPDGAGNSAQWTTSVSTPNWQCVDEIPVSDVDYVYTNTVNYVDTYTLGSLVGSISSIKCVQAQVRIQKEGSATPQNLGLVLRTNSTDYVSSDQLVTTTLKGLSALWQTNPSSTGVLWDVTAVNALEVGIKSKT